MEFNGAFGLTEISPRKQASTKADNGGVKVKQLVLELNLLPFTRDLAAAEVQRMKEDLLIKLPGAMEIGIGKRALGGVGAQSKMTELAAGEIHSVADVSQTFGLGEVIEEHGYPLVSGGKALVVAFCPAFMDKMQKRDPGNNLENLAKQTCGKLYVETSATYLAICCCFDHTTSGSLASTAQPENPFWTRMMIHALPPITGRCR